MIQPEGLPLHRGAESLDLQAPFRGSAGSLELVLKEPVDRAVDSRRRCRRAQARSGSSARTSRVSVAGPEIRVDVDGALHFERVLERALRDGVVLDGLFP